MMPGRVRFSLHRQISGDFATARYGYIEKAEYPVNTC